MAQLLQDGIAMVSPSRLRSPLRLVATSLLVATPACGSNPGGSSPNSVDAGPSGFPLGEYDNCAFATYLDTPGGGGLGGAGGSIVVTQKGLALEVRYGGDGGVLDTSLAFTATSGNSATLAAGQTLAGIQVSCAPLSFAPAVTQLASGSLTYNAGTLFFSVIGTVEPLDTYGTPYGHCVNPGGPAAFVVTCSEGSGTHARASDTGSTAGIAGAAAADFVGVYSCDSVPQQFGGNLISLGSGAGTLTVTSNGQVLTAAYSDAVVQGSLAFVATASNAASAARTNETMQLTCSSSQPPINQTPGTVPVASSTLALDGDHVFFAFAGSGCGEDYAVSVLCAPGDGGWVGP